MIMLLVVSPLGLTLALQPEASGPTASRSAIDPAVNATDAHNRTASWDLGNLTGWTQTNLVTVGKGAGLALDRTKYLSLGEYVAFGGAQHQMLSDLVVDSHGNSFIVWLEDNPGRQAYLRKFDPFGNPLTPQTALSSNSAYKTDARLVLTPQDGVIALWQDERLGAYHLFMQEFDSSANKVGSEVKVTDSAGDHLWPEVSHMFNDRFAVVWSMDNGVDYDVWARVMGSDGTKVTAELPVCVTAGHQLNEVIDMDSKGHFMVAWTNYAAVHPHIVAQRFDVNGTKNGTELNLSKPGSYLQDDSGITVDDQDNFILAWGDFENTEVDIYAQRIGTDGNKVGGFIPVCTASDTQYLPQITAESDNSLFFVWDDSRNQAQTGIDIWARHLDSSGNFLGDELQVDNGSNTQDYPKVDSSPDDNITVGWIDNSTEPKYDGHAVTYVHPRLSSGSVTTTDLIMTNLTGFGSFSAFWTGKNASGDHVWFNYSTNGGMSWAPVPANGSLRGVPIGGRIRFRADLKTTDPLTTPVLWNMTLGFTMNSVPKVSAGKVQTVFRNTPVRLNGTAKDDDGDLLALGWRQVSGPSVPLTDNTTLQPSFVPRSSGTYWFELSAHDWYSAATPSYVFIYVQNRVPSVLAGPDLTVWKKGTFYLNATGTDPDKDTLNYTWTQVSGPMIFFSTRNGTSLPLVGSAVGKYSFDVKVSDGEAFSAASVVNVTVLGRAPKAKLVTNATVLQINGTVSLDGSGSSDPDGNVTGYLFEFGDGHAQVWGNASKASRQYAAPGNYTVFLTVRDDDGNLSEKASIDLRVNAPPRVSFEMTTGDYTVAFNFSSTARDPDGTISEASWDFGDGTKDTGTKVSHLYKARGEYTVRLTVKDNDGALATTLRTVSMKNRLPVFGQLVPILVPNSTVGNMLSFGAPATDPDGDKVTYEWTVDGVKDPGANGSSFQYTAGAAGTYRIGVKVSDGLGGSISHDWTATVLRKPKKSQNNSFLLVLLVVLVIAIVIGLVVALMLRRKKARPAVGPSQAQAQPQGPVQGPGTYDPSAPPYQQDQYPGQQQYQQFPQQGPPLIEQYPPR